MFRLYSDAFAGGYVNVPPRSALEADVLGLDHLDLFLSAHNTASDLLTPALRDGKRQAVFHNAGAVKYGNAINGQPSVVAANAAGGYLYGDYLLPPSYSIFALCRLQSIAGASDMIFGSADSSGNRAFFGVLANGRAYFDHGAGHGVTDTTTVLQTGVDYILWCSFDGGDNTAALGINSLGAKTTGAIDQAHKGQGQSAIGGASTQTGDMEIAALVVLDVAAHKVANLAARTTVLSRLAEIGKVTLTA